MKRPPVAAGKRVIATLAVLAALVGTSLAPMLPAFDGVAQAQGPDRTASQAKEESRTLQVTGEGSVNVVPDVVQARLGVEAVSESLRDAWRDASQRMNAVIDSLLAQGIARVDIQTVRYSVYREERYRPVLEPTSAPVPPPTATPPLVLKPIPIPTVLPVPSSEIFRPVPATPVPQASPSAVNLGVGSVGVRQIPPPPSAPPPPIDGGVKPEATSVVYHVTNVVSVKIRQMDNAGDIIDAAIEAGANSIEDVSFAVDNPIQYRMQALELAVADAKGKAELLARLTGVTLGPPITITTYSFGPIFGRGGGDGVPSFVAAPMPIYSGQTEIQASVNITYSIQ